MTIAQLDRLAASLASRDGQYAVPELFESALSLCPVGARAAGVRRCSRCHAYVDAALLMIPVDYGLCGARYDDGWHAVLLDLRTRRSFVSSSSCSTFAFAVLEAALRAWALELFDKGEVE